MGRATVAVIAEQTLNADGSFTVRPVAVADRQDISTRRAAAMLGLHRQTVSQLCQLGPKDGGLDGWKTAGKRGNARWRISLQSVNAYLERRREESRGE
jgi:hypothetical protein